MEREPNDADFDGTDATGPWSVEFEWDGESRPSMLVIELLADVVGVDATDVGPIYEAVDPDALDRLFEDMPDGTARESGRVTFEVSDHTVRVYGSGRLVVWPPDPDAW